MLQGLLIYVSPFAYANNIVYIISFDLFHKIVTGKEITFD